MYRRPRIGWTSPPAIRSPEPSIQAFQTLSHFSQSWRQAKDRNWQLTLCRMGSPWGVRGSAVIEAVFMAPAIKYHRILLLIASFGVEAILGFKTIESPLAQP